MTPGDLDVLARTIYGEARGQPYEGLIAVAHVVFNRVRKGGRDGTISKACLRHLQFSCWNANDPNLPKMQAARLDDRQFREAMRAALEARDTPDVTRGATHYHTRAVAPDWSKGLTPCYAVGDHVFFNNVP